MDNRPEAEIRMGTALNAIEPLEAELDEFLMAIADAANVLWGSKREILLARHSAFAARCHVSQTLARVERSAHFLKDARTVAEGVMAMEAANGEARSLLSNVMTANAVFGQGVRPGDEKWEHEALWKRIVKRAGELPTVVEDAKTALTVAGLTALGR